MREIKFRQFIDGEFHYFGFLSDGTFTSPIRSDIKKHPVEQFTGFKDKNGTDIYEGDILNNCEIGGWSVCAPLAEGYALIDVDKSVESMNNTDLHYEIVGDVHKGA